MNKVELLAPAGDFESLRAAVIFGADAVYLGGSAFTMRASPSNFDEEQLPKAVEYAHSNGVKIYLTCNTLPRNNELKDLPEFLKFAQDCKVDAFIISDLGVFEMAKRYASKVEIHCSTQTGIVNYASCCALAKMGASRVVLARELSLKDIKEIKENIPKSLEIETFVHGAMCVSFSGRCLLSNYLTGRDANRGNCAQPCRWNYTLMENTRPGEYFPVFEDDKGTHIMNARDMCMIEHIPEIIDSGITSLKIEGRAKSAYYVAVVTNAYRIAIDNYYKNGENYVFDKNLAEEVRKVSHRSYCTGFYYGPIEKGQIYGDETYVRRWDIVAEVLECENNKVLVRERNPVEPEGVYEVVEPGKVGRPLEIKRLLDLHSNEIKKAVHPNMTFYMELCENLAPHSVIRKLAVD